MRARRKRVRLALMVAVAIAAAGAGVAAYQTDVFRWLGTSEIAPGGHTRILGGDANVKAARAVPASAQYNLDPNGVIRRIPFETDGLKTMPVVAYERAFGRLPDRKLFEPDGAWIDFA